MTRELYSQCDEWWAINNTSVNTSIDRYDYIAIADSFSVLSTEYRTRTVLSTSYCTSTSIAQDTRRQQKFDTPVRVQYWVLVQYVRVPVIRVLLPATVLSNTRTSTYIPVHVLGYSYCTYKYCTSGTYSIASTSTNTVSVLVRYLYEYSYTVLSEQYLYSRYCVTRTLGLGIPVLVVQYNVQ